MKAKLLLISALLLSLAGSALADAPAAAPTLLANAVKTAKAEHKGVLVLFHASWCGWCKQLDKTMETPEFKSVLDKDFVIVRVTVLENDAHKADENPGGLDLMKQMGGDNAGLPYYTVVDGDGKTVADSKVVAAGSNGKASNMGYPTEPNELSHFISMLKAGAPQITDEETAAMQTVLEKRAAEIKAKLAGH